jgi:histidine triad (HIT) family protein
MDNCLFCKIVKGEVPAYKVHEDEDFIAFLDIFPHVKGHTLVIPKQHYQWTYDVPNFGEYWEVARSVGRKVMSAVGANWMNFATMGEIPHAHIHILPRQGELNESSRVFPEGIHMTKEELSELAELISSQI